MNPDERLDSVLRSLVDVDTIMTTFPNALRSASMASMAKA